LRLTSPKYAAEVKAILSEVVDRDAASIIVAELLKNNRDFYDTLEMLINVHCPNQRTGICLEFNIARDKKLNAFRKSSVVLKCRYTETPYRGSSAWVFADDYGLLDGVIIIWCSVDAQGKLTDA
jgi:hypothetical protein